MLTWARSFGSYVLSFYLALSSYRQENQGKQTSFDGKKLTGKRNERIWEVCRQNFPVSEWSHCASLDFKSSNWIIIIYTRTNVWVCRLLTCTIQRMFAEMMFAFFINLKLKIEFFPMFQAQYLLNISFKSLFPPPNSNESSFFFQIKIEIWFPGSVQYELSQALLLKKICTIPFQQMMQIFLIYFTYFDIFLKVAQLKVLVPKVHFKRWLESVVNVSKIETLTTDSGHIFSYKNYFIKIFL